MRILLRDYETEAFFKTATCWTTNPREALDFENREAAIRVARELRLQNIEILHVHEDGTRFLGTRLDIDP